MADRRGLRPIGPGGYTGGECYRPVVELQLTGGDVISDVSLMSPLVGVAGETGDVLAIRARLAI